MFRQKFTVPFFLLIYSGPNMPSYQSFVLVRNEQKTMKNKNHVGNKIRHETQEFYGQKRNIQGQFGEKRRRVDRVIRTRFFICIQQAFKHTHTHTHTTSLMLFTLESGAKTRCFPRWVWFWEGLDYRAVLGVGFWFWRQRLR